MVAHSSGKTCGTELADLLIPIRSVGRIALVAVRECVYPGATRALVPPCRFVSLSPSPFGFPPQPGHGNWAVDPSIEIHEARANSLKQACHREIRRVKAGCFVY